MNKFVSGGIVQVCIVQGFPTVLLWKFGVCIVQVCVLYSRLYGINSSVSLHAYSVSLSVSKWMPSHTIIMHAATCDMERLSLPFNTSNSAILNTGMSEGKTRLFKGTGHAKVKSLWLQRQGQTSSRPSQYKLRHYQNVIPVCKWYLLKERIQ